MLTPLGINGQSRVGLDEKCPPIGKLGKSTVDERPKPLAILEQIDVNRLVRGGQAKLPAHIEIDTSEMHVGSVLHLSDLPAHDGYEIADDPCVIQERFDDRARQFELIDIEFTRIRFSGFDLSVRHRSSRSESKSREEVTEPRAVASGIRAQVAGCS